MGPRIPVHVVTGAARSGKSALIVRLCHQNGNWVGLVNALPSPGPNLRSIAAGCPCCTGKVVLQVSLARALRETGAVRAFVELPDPAHAETLKRVLGEPPLSLSVAIARSILLPGDSRLLAADLED